MIQNQTAITASSFVSMFCLGVAITVVGAAARNIGLTPAQIGLMMTMQNVGFGVGVLAAGALSDRLAKPRILFVASIVLSAMFFLFYRIDGFAVNVLIMTVIGAAIGGYEGATDAVLLDIHSRRESLFININHFHVSFGSLAITTYLIFLQMNWRRSLEQVALVAALLAVVFAFTRIPHESKAGRDLRAVAKTLGREPLIALLFTAQTLAIGLSAGTTAILTTFLMELRGFTQITSKLGLIVFISGLGLGRVFVGLLMRNTALHAVITWFFAASAVMLSLLYFVRLPTSVVFGLCFLAGLAASPLLPTIIAAAGLFYRDAAGTAMGAIKVAIPVGGVVIPALFSLISEVGTLSMSLTLFPLSAVIAVVVMAASRRMFLVKPAT